MTEKWKWWVDQTTGQSSAKEELCKRLLKRTRPTVTDEFDDGETARKQSIICARIANGWEWMRAEERWGKWLGLAAAVLIWGTLACCYVSSTWHPNQIQIDGKWYQLGHTPQSKP